MKKFLFTDLKRLITYETRYSLRSPNDNATDSSACLNKNTIQDHFEKLYNTKTEATKARNSARLKRVDRENDDPYDPDKFDRIRFDEAPVQDYPRKERQPVNQQKRTNQNAVPSKACENGKDTLLPIIIFYFNFCFPPPPFPSGKTVSTISICFGYDGIILHSEHSNRSVSKLSTGMESI